MNDLDGWTKATLNSNVPCSCGKMIIPGEDAYLQIIVTESSNNAIYAKEIICRTCMIHKYPMKFAMNKLPF